jgi:hypothetical protein
MRDVVVLSVAGSFRNLRAVHKLLLEGYFPEMHSTLRRVEQWLECAVDVEAYPETAEQILAFQHRIGRIIRGTLEH